MELLGCKRLARGPARRAIQPDYRGIDCDVAAVEPWPAGGPSPHEPLPEPAHVNHGVVVDLEENAKVDVLESPLEGKHGLPYERAVVALA